MVVTGMCIYNIFCLDVDAPSLPSPSARETERNGETEEKRNRETEKQRNKQAERDHAYQTWSDDTSDNVP